jgi:hypothetical protein
MTSADASADACAAISNQLRDVGRNSPLIFVHPVFCFFGLGGIIADMQGPFYRPYPS